MIRKTMRIGEVRTSIKLEAEFWSYLKEVADGRGMRMSALVNENSTRSPTGTVVAQQLRRSATGDHGRVMSASVCSGAGRHPRPAIAATPARSHR